MILIITITCIMFSSMISVAAQNSDARTYYNVVRNRIEDSNYSNDVMNQCVEEAKNKGYELEIKDISLNDENPSLLLSMKYKITIPIYKIINSGSQKEALIEGYAR